MLHHRGGGADAGRGAAGRAQVALVQQLQQLLLRGAAGVCGSAHTRDPGPARTPRPVSPRPTLVLALADHVHGGGQVPHLDAAVGVAGEQVAPGPRAHPAGALALAHGEGGDGGAVHGLDLADPGRDGARG